MGTRPTLVALITILVTSFSNPDAGNCEDGVRAPGVGARIVNGDLTTGDYPSTGALLWAPSFTSSDLNCSGTMIGCETFLTAAHCVCEGTGSECQPGDAWAPDPDDYAVFLQHGGIFRVAEIEVHASYNFPTADIAVVKLTEAVDGIPPTPINTHGKPPNGSSATIVGFGKSGGNARDYGLKRVGKVETSACGTNTLVCWNFEAPMGPRGEDSNTCYGDSGGPLFWDSGSGDTVAGVTSGGVASGCGVGDEAFDVNVYHYRSWIQARGGSDLSNSTCGSGPQVGDDDVAVTTASGLLSTQAKSATHVFDSYPATGKLHITLNHDESARFDLLVKHASPPSTSDHDCAQLNAGAFDVCSFENPDPGIWYATVQRISGTGEYQLTASAFGICDLATEGQSCDDADPCTENDTCQAAVCTGDALPDGTSCNDGSGCSQDDQCSSGVCSGSFAPVSGCKEAAAGASTLLLKNRSPDSRDLLRFHWGRGAETTLADLGDPASGSVYTACLWENDADPNLLLEATIPSGSSWRPTKKGWRYRNRAGASDGVRSLKFNTGAPGKASAKLVSGGENFEIPTLPLNFNPTITLQLLGPDACFTADFSTPQRNDSEIVKARGD